MVYGIDGVPANELLNETRLQTRYKEVYELIEAQRAGSQFRTKSSMLNHTLPQLTGSVRDPHRLRLVQSTISTRLLEIILGLMLFWPPLQLSGRLIQDARCPNTRVVPGL